MEQAELELIRKNRPALVQGLRTDTLVDELVAAGVLLEHHENEITRKHSAEDKNREFLRIIVTIRPSAFQSFLVALKDTRQDKLLALLQGQSVVAAAADTTDEALLRKFESLNDTQFKNLLQRNLHPLITNNMNSTQLLLYLLTHGVLDHDTHDNINTGKTSSEKNTMLYNYLRTRPKSDLLTFVKGLINTNQKHIAEELGKGIDS